MTQNSTNHARSWIASIRVDIPERISNLSKLPHLEFPNLKFRRTSLSLDFSNDAQTPVNCQKECQPCWQIRIKCVSPETITADLFWRTSLFTAGPKGRRCSKRFHVPAKKQNTPVIASTRVHGHQFKYTLVRELWRAEAASFDIASNFHRRVIPGRGKTRARTGPLWTLPVSTVQGRNPCDAKDFAFLSEPAFI